MEEDDFIALIAEELWDRDDEQYNKAALNTAYCVTRSRVQIALPTRNPTQGTGAPSQRRLRRED